MIGGVQLLYIEVQLALVYCIWKLLWLISRYLLLYQHVQPICMSRLGPRMHFGPLLQLPIIPCFLFRWKRDIVNWLAPCILTTSISSSVGLFPLFILKYRMPWRHHICGALELVVVLRCSALIRWVISLVQGSEHKAWRLVRSVIFLMADQQVVLDLLLKLQSCYRWMFPERAVKSGALTHWVSYEAILDQADRHSLSKSRPSVQGIWVFCIFWWVHSIEIVAVGLGRAIFIDG